MIIICIYYIFMNKNITKKKYKNKKYNNKFNKTKNNKNKYIKNNKFNHIGGNNNNNKYKASWDPNIISPVFFGYVIKR